MQSEVRLWHNGSLYPSSLLALFLRIRLLSDVLDAPAGVADTARTSTLAKSITNFVGRMDIRPFTVGPCRCRGLRRPPPASPLPEVGRRHEDLRQPAHAMPEPRNRFGRKERRGRHSGRVDLAGA